MSPDRGPGEGRLRPSVVDSHLAHVAIRNAIAAWAPTVGGVVVDIGCGRMPYRELVLGAGASAYIGVDLFGGRYGSPDVPWDGKRLPFRAASVRGVLATEVLEHVADPEPLLREVHRLLAPGGSLLLTVPFVWPLHDHPDDHHRFTPPALDRLLRHSGFRSVDVEATGGWDAALAQMLGLWARRRFGRIGRRLVPAVVTPAVAALRRTDTRPTALTSNTMFPGLVAIATA